LHLPGDYGAKAVEKAMIKAIATLPEELALSITWDQGKEMVRHKSFTVATGIPVYFCDPHSPVNPGSVVPTRTPMDCCANSCPRPLISPSTAPKTLCASNAASTDGLARPSVI
jgi:hypothetical protein